METKKYNCFFQLATDIIGGKWKSMVLWALQKDVNTTTKRVRRGRYC